MKYLYAIIFLLLFASNVNAQKIRFCDTSNKWTILEYILGGFPYPNTSITSLNGDTVMNGHQYYKLYSLSNGYIREDTTLGIVYMKIMLDYDSIDVNEQVLYNYNLQLGDTTTHYSLFGNTYIYVVVEVDSVSIQNTWHKTWLLQMISGSSGQPYYYIIEGIGSLGGPSFPINPHNFEAFFKLKCFETNGSNPLVSPMVNNYFDNSTSCTMFVENTTKNLDNIFVVPNPATKESKIIFNSSIKLGQLTVFNSIGQKVIDVSVQDVIEYKIGDKITVQGLYYFMLTDLTENSTYTGKFVY